MGKSKKEDDLFITYKVKLSELKDTEYNPRTLTEKQYRDLKRSINKFGLVEIPAINLDGTILAGHMRLKILKEKHGDDYEIDVRKSTRQLSKEEADEYLIRSNANTGSWDWDILANNFDAEFLTHCGMEFPEMNTEETVNALQEQEDSIIEEDQTDVSPGDVFEVGDHQINCGEDDPRWVQTMIDEFMRIYPKVKVKKNGVKYKR